MTETSITIEDLLEDIRLPTNAVANLSALQKSDLRMLLIDFYPESTHYAFWKAGDNEGLSIARDKLLKYDSKVAYEAFSDAGDDEGLSIARERFTESNPWMAYDVFKKVGDKKGLSLVGRKLLDSNPKRAYEALSDAGDNESIPILVDNLTKKYNLPVEVVKEIVYK